MKELDLAGRAAAESRSEMLGNRLYQILAPVKAHEKATDKPQPSQAAAKT